MICILKQAALSNGMKTLPKLPGSVALQNHLKQFYNIEMDIFIILLLPSAMIYVVNGAAYQFLCKILLAKLTQPVPQLRHMLTPDELSVKMIATTEAPEK